MANSLVDQHDAVQVAHDLMHFDQDAPGPLSVESHGFDVRIDLPPLLGPVGADLFWTTDKTAFERARPSHIIGHEGEGRLDVARVEACVRCEEQLDFRRGLISLHCSVQ